MQSVSPSVTGLSPSLTHQGFLEENQNNLPRRAKSWRQAFHLQQHSEMEAGTALPAFSPGTASPSAHKNQGRASSRTNGHQTALAGGWVIC